MITGKIRAWPKGANFSNQFVQIHLKIVKELFLFNGYMDQVQIGEFNILMASHWDGIELVNMKARDPRKQAKEELDYWAKSRDKMVYRLPVIFLTQIHLELLSEPKTEDLIPSKLLEEVKTEITKENNESFSVDDLEQEI